MARWTTYLALAFLALGTPRMARAADCQNPDCRPDVIPAGDRSTPPEGFRRVTRHYQGPLIGGAIAAGVGGIFFVGGASGEMRGDPDYSPLFMAMGGASLATGVALITYAFLGQEDVFVRERSTLSVSPLVSAQGAGGTVRFAF